eukprot:c22266_g2_i5 orf=1-396(-)
MHFCRLPSLFFVFSLLSCSFIPPAASPNALLSPFCAQQAPHCCLWMSLCLWRRVALFSVLVQCSQKIFWNPSSRGVQAMNLLGSGGTAPIIRSGEQRRVQDLDLRLGRSKNASLPSTRSNSQAITIVVEDDD